MPNDIQRKNLKIKIKSLSNNLITGLSHSKLTDSDKIEYFFSDEKAAQSISEKFQMPKTSMATVVDSFGNRHYKVTPTAEQFDKNNFATLRQFYLWLEQENFGEIVSKLPTLADEFMADLMLLVDDNENLLAKAIVNDEYDLVNKLIMKADPDSLSLSLLHPLDQQGLFCPITILLQESFRDIKFKETANRLARKSLEKMTQASIDFLLHLKDPEGYFCFAFLAKNIAPDNLDLLIEKASTETIDTLLLLQMNPKYSKSEGLNGFFLASTFRKDTLNKILRKATTQTLNQVVISIPNNNNVQTNGLQAIILNSLDSYDILIEKLSSEALKIALIQRNQANESGFEIAVNFLTKESLSKLLKKLRPDWIEDLISMLVSVTQHYKVRDALNDKIQVISQSKVIPQSDDKKSDKTIKTLLSEIKELNTKNQEVQKLISEDFLDKQLLAVQKVYFQSSSLQPIFSEDGKSKKPISVWNKTDCKKWAKTIKNLNNNNYELKLIPDDVKLSDSERHNDQLIIRIDTNGLLSYFISEMKAPATITAAELKASDRLNASNVKKYKLDILAIALKRGHINNKKLTALENPEIISIIIRAVELFAHYKPRESQVLSLLLLLQERNKGRLTQISTGEGKSLIVAMLAIIKVLMGQKVDVITSSPLLAERDAKDHNDLYDIFDITVSNNWDKENYHSGLKKCYKSDVVYGDNMGFQWDLLRHEYLMENTRGNRPYNTAIVDEVDSMLVDGHSHTARLSTPKPSMEYFGLLFISAWQELVRIELKINSLNEYKSLGNIEKENIIKKILKEYLTKLIKDQDSVISVPKHLKELALYLIDNWVESAITARYKYVLGRHYAIALDKDKKTKVIAPIDYMRTGIIQNNMHWDDGLQQFLQIKHNLMLESSSMEASFISNTAYFKRYGTNVYGMTGTLGSVQTQELLQHIYPIDFIFIPTFRLKQLVQLPGILCESNKEWLFTITQRVKSLLNKSAVLIICESINSAKQVENGLKEVKEIPANKIKSYTRNDNEENLAISETLTLGDCIIATNLAGRGADINTSSLLEENDGLTVITTFLPENKRIEDQASGRTARKGNKGKAELIIDKSAILPKLISECPEHKDFETIKGIKECRDKIEIKRLDVLKKFELEKVTLQDQLFSQFCKLTQSLRAVRNDKNKLSEVEDTWVFWLKKLTDKIEKERSFDKEVVLKDFSSLAEKIKVSYEEELKNPSQLILKANKSHGSSSSILDYTKAIAQDPIVCFQAYYNRAFARIKSRSENCRQDAINDLLETRRIISDTIIPQIQSMQVLVNLTPGQQTAQTDLIQQLQTKINLYQLEIQSINKSVQVIQNAAGNSTFAVNESYDIVDKLPRHQQSELYLSGLQNLFDIQEVKQETNWLGVLAVVFLGVVQIVAGVFLNLVPGMQVIGSALISEGVGDIMYAVRSVLEGTFSWDQYLATKTASVAITVITLGIDSIHANLSKALPQTSQQLTRSQLMDTAKSRVTKSLITSGIKEVANFGLHKLTGKVLDNFESDITNQIKNTVVRYLNQPAAKAAINALIAADLRNGNMHYAIKMKQLSSDIIRSKQAVSRISMNILKGALSQQHTGLAAFIKIADMGASLEKITSLAESFCEDFVNGVKILAQTLPLSGQEHNETRTTLFDSIANIISRCIMATLQGQIINPATDLLASSPLAAFSENIHQLTQAEFGNDKNNSSTILVKPEKADLTPDSVMKNFRKEISSTANRVKSLLIKPLPPSPSTRVVVAPTTKSTTPSIARSDKTKRSDKPAIVSQVQHNQSEGRVVIKKELREIFLSNLKDQIPNLSVIANVQNGIQDNFAHHAVTNFLQTAMTVNQYRKSVASGVLNGVTSGISHAVKMVLHPLDTIVYPVTSFFHDAQIVGAGSPLNAVNGRMIDINDPDSALLHYIMQQNPNIYHDAVNRVQARAGDVIGISNTFVNATGPQRAEMLASTLVSCAMPGTILKSVKMSAKIGATAASNYHHFRVFNPLKFDDIVRDFRIPPEPLPLLILTEAGRLLKDGERLGYVITENRKLILSRRYFSPNRYSPSEGFGKIRVDHSQLAGGKKVYAAGELTYIDGKILIDNSSGHFQPRGKNIGKLVERIFSKNGYTEIGTSSFTPIFTHATIPQTISFPIGFTPAGIPLFLFNNTSNPAATPAQNNREEINSSTIRIGSLLRSMITAPLNFVSGLVISSAAASDTFPKCKRPYYEDAETAYSKVDGYGNMDSIGSLIGGKVQQNLASGIFKNACVLRASYSLFNSNEVQSQVSCEIPRIKTGNGAETVSGGDGKQYIYRVNTLIDFLTHAWGPPDYDGRKNSNNDYSNPSCDKEGVVIFLSPESSNQGFTGHAMISDDFYPSKNALFWRLSRRKEKIPEQDMPVKDGGPEPDRDQAEYMPFLP